MARLTVESRAPSARGATLGRWSSFAIVGAIIINLGTYALLIAVFPTLARIPIIPLSVGAALAVLFNYAGASRWVFAVARPGNREAQ